jgi:hypothetical protein
VVEPRIVWMRSWERRPSVVMMVIVSVRHSKGDKTQTVLKHSYSARLRQYADIRMALTLIHYTGTRVAQHSCMTQAGHKRRGMVMHTKSCVRACVHLIIEICTDVNMFSHDVENCKSTLFTRDSVLLLDPRCCCARRVSALVGVSH